MVSESDTRHRSSVDLARPGVATRVGGLPEVIVHEKTGLLVEIEDSNALAEAVGFILDYPESAARMGLAARKRAQKMFGWNQYVGAYDALYQKLLLSAKKVSS